MRIDRESSGSLIPIAEQIAPGIEKPRISIVVPCYNEESALPYLWNTMGSVKQVLEQQYEIYLILVDDGSTDGTWRLMLESFGGEPNCTLLRQPKNLGVGASILTGIRSAKTEIVCSIDCDCTYDLHDLKKLVPMLNPGVDLVTGSPYHPLGRVHDVPRWRLVLSKTASALYRRVLSHKLYTYTSCFRVYRRSAILKLDLRRNGFLGIAELIAKLDLQGSLIVECPTSLVMRVRGASKMKITRVIAGHLHLLCQLLVLRGRQSVFASRPTALESTKLEERLGKTT